MTSTSGAPRAPRVSPRGDQVAFVCYTGPQLGNNDTTGGIAVVDRAGKRRDFAMSAGIKDEYLAWSPDGREIYFTAPSGVLAMDLDGHTRAVNPDSTPPLVQDVSAQGVMLLEREVQTVSPVVRSGGADLDLGWQDRSTLAGFSRDGSQVLIWVTGGGESTQNRPFLRRLDGSPPKMFAPGFPLDLSAAGDFALVATPGNEPRLLVVPTGLGAARELGLEGWNVSGGRFSADGKWVYATARQRTGPLRILKLPVDGSQGAALPELIQNVQFISPDGRRMLCLDATGQLGITSAAGEPPAPVPWTLQPGEAIAGWNASDELLVTHPEDVVHVRVDRVVLATGRRTVWQRLVPPDPATTIRMEEVRVSADWTTLGYSCDRVLVSDLLLARGLR